MNAGIAIAITFVACAPTARVGAHCATEPAFLPFDRPVPPAPHALPPSGVVDAMLAAYQADGRAPTLPGTGCPFAPTCSVFARTAVDRYGAAGLLLVVDRLLVREHPAAGAYYPTICVDHTTRLRDAVP